MSRAATVSAALILLFGAASASHGGLHAANQSDRATASQSGGGPDGSWKLDVQQLNATCLSSGSDDGVDEVEFPDGDSAGDYRVIYEGRIVTSNPCHTVEGTDITREGDTFSLNVRTEDTSEVCVDCVGSLRYRVTFSADEPFKLSVSHDGDRVETVRHPSWESAAEPGPEKNGGGLVSSLMKFLRSLV